MCAGQLRASGTDVTHKLPSIDWTYIMYDVLYRPRLKIIKIPFFE